MYVFPKKVTFIFSPPTYRGLEIISVGLLAKCSLTLTVLGKFVFYHPINRAHYPPLATLKHKVYQIIDIEYRPHMSQPPFQALHSQISVSCEQK